MAGRSWIWFRRRIVNLLTLPPTYRPDGAVMHQTRLGHSLFPPQAPRKEHPRGA